MTPTEDTITMIVVSSSDARVEVRADAARRTARFDEMAAAMRDCSGVGGFDARPMS
jgi:hypothetical protein